MMKHTLEDTASYARQRCNKCGKMVDTVFIVGWGFAPPYINRVCLDCYDELLDDEITKRFEENFNLVPEVQHE